MARYYNRKGKPITLTQWAEEFEDSESRRVDVTQVDVTQVDYMEVSTVFLGLNHQFGEGPPLIFETMVFGGPLNDECERYSTEAQAKLGHAAMVGRVKEASW